MKFIYSKKKLSILVIIIAITALAIMIFLANLSNTEGKIRILSYPVDVKQETNVSYPIKSENHNLIINYVHPSNSFEFDYPSTWEFLPERQDFGLRPKKYTCKNECFNEVVTIIYSQGKGGVLREWASTFDGANDWQSVNLAQASGIYYLYKSDSIVQHIYWLSNGKDAVKLMFREYDKYSNDGNFDNLTYLEDFRKMLDSFKFKNT